MRFIYTLTCVLIIHGLKAQQIVYTEFNSLSQDIFWKTNTAPPFIYQKITDSLNQHSQFIGVHKGPISTSHNGNYYVFQSERFENSATSGMGYPAITICKSDFSYFEVPKDATGSVFHSEGIMQITNDGATIYFVQSGGTHTRDVFKITKGATSWTNPVELSSISNYSFNISPYISYDETKILFESSHTSAYSTAIQESLNNGVTLSIKTATTLISNSIQVKSPCYDVLGNIYFECQTDAERVWKLSASGGSPIIINNLFTNDNSPVTLPDGRIASLYVQNSTHQIKIMDHTGLNDFMVTSPSPQFTEVFDIGISAGGAIPLGVKDLMKIDLKFGVYPNPNKGAFTIDFSEKIKSIKAFDLLGCEIELSKTSEMNYKLVGVYSGVYLVQIETNNGNIFSKRLILEN